MADAGAPGLESAARLLDAYRWERSDKGADAHARTLAGERYCGAVNMLAALGYGFRLDPSDDSHIVTADDERER